MATDLFPPCNVLLAQRDPLAPFSRWHARAWQAAWELHSPCVAVLGALSARRAAILHTQRARASDTAAHQLYYREEAARLRAMARADLVRARALRAAPVRVPYLLIACSGTKRPDAQWLPALSRYDGPAYRVLRGAVQATGCRPSMRILSAELGLISPQTAIPDYNRCMDDARMREYLQSGKGAAEVSAHLHAVRPTDILVMGGARYREVFHDALVRANLPTHVRQLTVHGGIGEQLGQLRRWLHGLPVPDALDLAGTRGRPRVRPGSAATDGAGWQAGHLRDRLPLWGEGKTQQTASRRAVGV
ncbi:hypothetical protein LMG32289_05608 [Cupriavidus pampae]|uniref:DUF6884 domain-containing protein n=1 Tax=Cupriavidus pampae TaxID=659251 RepID=A0ABN7ZK78_9BURK|nr:hypothetical protein LMG32289_05608 [Cupriavidus pampae]